MAISPERREELRKIARENVARLLATPTTAIRDLQRTELKDPNEVFIGPRGGRYRINSNGRKSYDVP